MQGMKFDNQACWCIPVFPALRRLKQEDREFEVSLSYIERSHLKKKTQTIAIENKATMKFLDDSLGK
jgi:hypothetical protein